MKTWTFRLPDEVLTWLRQEAGRRTSQSEYVVSLNALAVEILTEAMKSSGSYKKAQAEMKKLGNRKATLRARRVEREGG